MTDLPERNDESRTSSIVGAIVVPHPPLIVPQVGRGDEARIQATIDAYRFATRALLDRKPDVLVITSPHAPMFRDGFHVTTDDSLFGDMAQFRARDARIYAECDVELAEEIVRQAIEVGIPCTGSESGDDDEMDHGTFVPLHFICNAALDGEGDAPWDGDGLGVETAQPPCPIVRIGLSGLSPETHRQLGRVIAHAGDMLGRRIGFIASGDLSHRLLAEGPYGYAPEGPEFDERIGEIFATGNLEALFDFDEDFCDSAAECGLRSFQIMYGAIEGLDFSSRMLSNEGPFGVGYGIAVLMPPNADVDDYEGPYMTEVPDGADAQDDTAKAEVAEADADGATREEETAEDVVAAPAVHMHEPTSEGPVGFDAIDYTGVILTSDDLDATDGAEATGDDEGSEGDEDAVSSRSKASDDGDAGVDASDDASDTGELLLLVDYSSNTEVDPHIRLARLAVETFAASGEFAELPDDVPPELLERRAGVFVSLHAGGELRGCIGTTSPVTDSIAAEVMRNAVFACSDDPRFSPVRPEELDHLEYSVDVLGEAERIATPLDLDPERYGVIVTKGWRHGLLLPNLEGVNSVDQQLRIAKQKAGIHPNDDDVELERFEVVRHTLGGEPRIG